MKTGLHVLVKKLKNYFEFFSELGMECLGGLVVESGPFSKWNVFKPKIRHLFLIEIVSLNKLVNFWESTYYVSQWSIGMLSDFGEIIESNFKKKLHFFFQRE